jgi:hypothetical protein
MIIHNRRAAHTAYVALLICVATSMGVLAISWQSFWMDEGGPAFKALMPTFKDWWQMTLRLGGSDTQMPVYMFLLWIWEKLAGHDEFTMRAINLPWLAIAVLSLRKVRYWPVVCLTSPFILYYTGELRPYAMQIAAGAFAASALMKVGRARLNGDLKGIHSTAAASLLLSCSSLTGTVWALGLWLGFFLLVPQWLKRKEFWIKLIPWTIGALVLAAYYSFTLLKGYRAAGLESSSILSVLFGIYELIGLLGYGPGKNELRESLGSLISHLPVLIPVFLTIFGAWLWGTWNWMKKSSLQTIAAVSCAVILPILILSAVGLAMDFRVLGRHLSPVIPAVLLPIALALSSQGSWSISGRFVAWLAVACSFGSAVSLRVLERHERDDFRQASTLCLNALKNGQTVWWQADMNCMRYYAYLEGGMPLVYAVQILESKPPSSLLMTDYVIINRPDLKYPRKDHQKMFRQNSFHLERKFTGLEVWRSSIP